MKYTGTIAADALLSDAVLNFVEATEQGGVTSFVVEDEFVLAIADELSRSLKPGVPPAVIKNEYDMLVVFPNKVFRFAPKEVEKKQKAVEYAKTLGITEQQLHF